MGFSRTTPIEQLPEFLRIDETAQYLGISRGLVYELAKRGDLRVVSFGRLLRVPREALAALVLGSDRR